MGNMYNELVVAKKNWRVLAIGHRGNETANIYWALTLNKAFFKVLYIE